MFGIASAVGVDARILASYNDWPDGIAQMLAVGTVVRIPIGDDPDEPDDRAPGGSATTTCVHTIGAGDTPLSIAERYGISVDELIGANPPEVTSEFLVGSVLVVPDIESCG